MPTSAKGITTYGYDPKTGTLTPRAGLSTPPAQAVDSARAERQFQQAKRIFMMNMEPLVEGLVRRSQNTRDPRGITPRTYGEQLMAQLRTLALTALTAGAGGLRRVTESDLAKMDAWLDTQRDYMFRWTGQLERADPKTWPSKGQLLTRAGMYAENAMQLIDRMRLSVLAPGLPEMPFYPKDRTLCRHNCLCGWGEPIIVSAANGDYDIKWLLNVRGVTLEHCGTCLVRAEICNPLQVRGGRIITDLSNPGLYAP